MVRFVTSAKKRSAPGPTPNSRLARMSSRRTPPSRAPLRGPATATSRSPVAVVTTVTSVVGQPRCSRRRPAQAPSPNVPGCTRVQSAPLVPAARHAHAGDCRRRERRNARPPRHFLPPLTNSSTPSLRLARARRARGSPGLGKKHDGSNNSRSAAGRAASFSVELDT